MIRAHGDIALIAALFTLAMTLPTIVYVFRRDVFWLPTLAKLDIFNHLWDMWYGGLLLSGQESRFYTDMIFHPDGVSRATHPLICRRSWRFAALCSFCRSRTLSIYPAC